MYSSEVLEDSNIDIRFPLDSSEDTVLMFLCGVHGVGKTSIAKRLPELFEEIGAEAYYIREMNRKPNLKAGTPEFQEWYAKRMDWRDNSIAGQLNPFAMVRPEILIMDRIKQDVDVYTNIERWDDKEFITELAHDLVFELRQWADFYRDREGEFIHVYCFLIYRDVEDVMMSLRARMLEAGQEQRKGWDEDNIDRWIKLYQLFKYVWVKAQYIVENMKEYSHDNIYIILKKNDNIEQSAEDIVEEVRLLW